MGWGANIANGVKFAYTITQYYTIMCNILDISWIYLGYILDRHGFRIWKNCAHQDQLKPFWPTCDPETRWPSSIVEPSGLSSSLVSTQEASNNKKHGCGEWEKTHTKTASSWCSWGAGETDAAKLDIYSIVYWMNPFMSATGPGTNHFSTHFVVHGSKPGNHLGCASLKNMDISIDQ